MTVTTCWWWIRHAPVHNPDHRLYGQDDLDAVTDESAHFQALAARLPADAVWVGSHLRRTHQTAAALRPFMEAQGHSTPELEVIDQIAEQYFGDWQGLTPQELRDTLGDEFHNLWRSPGRAEPPGGESFADVLQRVGAAVEAVNQRHAGRNIIAFAHGGSIRAALAVALGLGPDVAVTFRIENLSLTRIDHIVPGENPPIGSSWPWRIEGVNILAHSGCATRTG